MFKSGRDLYIRALRERLPAFIHRSLLTVSPGVEFQPNWHVEAMAHHLEQCRTGAIRRLAITIPPRHLKSLCASVAFPAWLLGHDPTLAIVVVSYAKDLAEDFAMKFRTVVNADWYRTAFPRMRGARDTQLEFTTTERGYRLATSVGGTLTGRGADFVIIDDPIKPDEAASKTTREAATDWYRSTLLSRLNDQTTGRIIIVMQRLHQDDLVGYVLEREPGVWTHLDLPAIASEDQHIPIGGGRLHHRLAGDLLDPKRQPQGVLDSLKDAMGSADFAAQYLQQPIPAEGNMIRRSWLTFYDQPPIRDLDAQIIQSWDTAQKPDQRNDPSACTTWLVVNGKYYLVDVIRKRVDFPGLKQLVLEAAARWQPHSVLIEDTGSGTALIQELSREGRLHPIAITPKGDKEMRMHGQTAKIESGQVLFPRDAPWLAEFLNELLAFPNSRHDDQVDSVAQFLKWVGERQEHKFSYDMGWDDPADARVRFPFVD